MEDLDLVHRVVLAGFFTVLPDDDKPALEAVHGGSSRKGREWHGLVARGHGREEDIRKEANLCLRLPEVLGSFDKPDRLHVIERFDGKVGPLERMVTVWGTQKVNVCLGNAGREELAVALLGHLGHGVPETEAHAGALVHPHGAVADLVAHGISRVHEAGAANRSSGCGSGSRTAS